MEENQIFVFIFISVIIKLSRLTKFRKKYILLYKGLVGTTIELLENWNKKLRHFFNNIFQNLKITLIYFFH